MPLYVLDTDTFSLLLSGHKAVCERVLATPQADLAVTIVTVDESLTGWYTQIRQARSEESVIRAYDSLQRVVEQLRIVRIVAFNEVAASIARSMRTQDRRVGTNDLRIAAITIGSSGILITCNRKDFSRFPQLSIEDWSIAASNPGS